MQDKIALSSADFATRLSFLREKQGLTLGVLADGSPSTAKSWLEGKQPRSEKWRGISDRVGLSESLIFLGRPADERDYAFIAKWRAAIEDADELLKARPGERFSVHEEGSLGQEPLPTFSSQSPSSRSLADVVAANPNVALKASREPTAEEVLDYVKECLAVAKYIPGGVGHVYIEITDAVSLEKLRERKKKLSSG